MTYHYMRLTLLGLLLMGFWRIGFGGTVLVVVAAGLLVTSPYAHVFLDLSNPRKEETVDPPPLLTSFTKRILDASEDGKAEGDVPADGRYGAGQTRHLELVMPADLAIPLGEMLDHFVRDFVLYWYDPLSFQNASEAFPRQVRRSLNVFTNSIYERSVRLRSVDVTAQMLSTFTYFLLVALRRRRHALTPSLSSNSPLPPPPPFPTDTERLATLRASIRSLLTRSLKAEDVANPLVMELLTELISKQAWEQIKGFGDPDYINLKIIEWAGEVKEVVQEEKERLEAVGGTSIDGLPSSATSSAMVRNEGMRAEDSLLAGTESLHAIVDVAAATAKAVANAAEAVVEKLDEGVEGGPEFPLPNATAEGRRPPLGDSVPEPLRHAPGAQEPVKQEDVVYESSKLGTPRTVGSSLSASTAVVPPIIPPSAVSQSPSSAPGESNLKPSAPPAAQHLLSEQEIGAPSKLSSSDLEGALSNASVGAHSISSTALGAPSSAPPRKRSPWGSRPSSKPTSQAGSVDGTTVHLTPAAASQPTTLPPETVSPSSTQPRTAAMTIPASLMPPVAEVAESDEKLTSTYPKPSAVSERSDSSPVASAEPSPQPPSVSSFASSSRPISPPPRVIPSPIRTFSPAPSLSSIKASRTFPSFDVVMAREDQDTYDAFESFLDSLASSPAGPPSPHPSFHKAMPDRQGEALLRLYTQLETFVTIVQMTSPDGDTFQQDAVGILSRAVDVLGRDVDGELPTEAGEDQQRMDEVLREALMKVYETPSLEVIQPLRLEIRRRLNNLYDAFVTSSTLVSPLPSSIQTEQPRASPTMTAYPFMSPLGRRDMTSSSSVPDRKSTTSPGPFSIPSRPTSPISAVPSRPASRLSMHSRGASIDVNHMSRSSSKRSLILDVQPTSALFVSPSDVSVTVTDVSIASDPAALVSPKILELMIAIEGVTLTANGEAPGPSSASGFMLFRRWADLEQLATGLASQAACAGEMAMPPPKLPSAKLKTSEKLMRELEVYLRSLLLDRQTAQSAPLRDFLDKERTAASPGTAPPSRTTSPAPGQPETSPVAGIQQIAAGAGATVPKRPLFGKSPFGTRSASSFDLSQTGRMFMKNMGKTASIFNKTGNAVSIVPPSTAASGASSAVGASADHQPGFYSPLQPAAEVFAPAPPPPNVQLKDQEPRVAPLSRSTSPSVPSSPTDEFARIVGPLPSSTSGDSAREEKSPLEEPRRSTTTSSTGSLPPSKQAPVEEELTKEDVDRLLSSVFAVAYEAFNLTTGQWTLRKGMMRVLEQIIRTQYQATIVATLTSTSRSLNQSNIAGWLTDLKDYAWPDGTWSTAMPPTRTPEQKAETKKRAREVLLSYAPAQTFVLGPGGKQATLEALSSVHDTLQNPEMTCDLALILALELIQMA